jgi:hypothetical protein
MHEYHTYEPRIFGWKTPIEDMYPYLPRKEFRSNMLIEPTEGWMNPEYPDVVRPPCGQVSAASESEATVRSRKDAR